MTSTQLALANLLHQRGRTLISLTGAGFAVILIFMQLGFLGSVNNTASLLYDKLQFDLIMISREYIDNSRPGSFEKQHLVTAQSVTGVKTTYPVSLTTGSWRNPLSTLVDPIRGRKKWQISLIAVEPDRLDDIFTDDVFDSADHRQRCSQALRQTNVVLLDRRSRPDFGNPDLMPVGTLTELNRQDVELGEYFQIGTGFSYSGLLIMSEETYSFHRLEPASRITFGLITLQPEAAPETVLREIRARVPEDVTVLTRARLIQQEREYWVNRTAVGKFFYFGVLLAMLVGGIFIYQMMVADIKKNLPEYATLKAMGYEFQFLFQIVLGQSIFLAVTGFGLGLGISLLLYQMTRNSIGLPIWMTVERMLIVLAITVIMCVSSGLLAVRKVRTADPADLF